jgi:uncharacterized protein (TIGR03437 family)
VERDWNYAMPADGRLPECIAGVCVTLGKRTAHVRYVRPDRVDFLLPPDLAPGRYSLEIRTPQGAASTAIDLTDIAPAWNASERGGRLFAADRPLLAPGMVTLRAAGLGASAPAATAGSVMLSPLPAARLPDVFIAGYPATVTSAVLAEPGVWLVEFRLPEGLPPGVTPIQLCSGSICSRSDVFVEIAPE